ncbi:MAG: hypothetical protein IIA67_02215 [Planctomycetes bacterium]|nr:hypothetical protein [Planctomycetota bacterium]
MANPKPKRRWYQFSLRTLLIAMTVATVAFGGWVQLRRQRAQANRDRVAAVEEAVAVFEKMGGTVLFGGGQIWPKPKPEYEERRPPTWLEKQFDDPGDADDPVRTLNVTVVNLYETKVTDADLKYLKELTYLVELNLSDTNVTDAGMKPISQLNRLEDVDFYGTKITDAGLQHLSGLERLRHLNLGNTNVTDAGLEHLADLRKLEWINLHNTQVGDAGLEHLTGLANLQSLVVDDTDVTDAGLQHLTGLTNLEYLSFIGTNVTNEGIEQLQQVLPNCFICRPPPVVVNNAKRSR